MAYVIVFGLGAFAIMGLVWSITKGGPGGDLPKEVRPVALLQKENDESTARVARLVTILESPHPLQAEVLRTFTVSLRMTGIIGGPIPRALIEGVAHQVGDVLDRPRGIAIVHVDSEKNAVVLCDTAGNIVQRVLE